MNRRVMFSIMNILFVAAGYSQNVTYTQFWNEFSFSKTLKGKWSLEGNIGQTWTNAPPDYKSMYAYSAQIYARVWAHHYMNAKWKFSVFYAYYYNKYVPEIDQREYPEGRLGLQATWYIKKGRYTLLSRMRVEDRHIRNTDGYNEGVYRFRDQIKIIYPFNSKRIRAGVIYGFGSGEVFFKTPSNVTGRQFFDRTRFTFGTGYSITDNTQIEASYVNEFLPRTEHNEIYNAFQVNVSFNNLIPGIKKAFHRKPATPEISN